MADFSLTTVFVVPSSFTALASTGSTQNLTPGQLGIFDPNYAVDNTPADKAYFYIAQGRTNNYLEGSKRSDKIKGAGIPLTGNAQTVYPNHSNVTEWYKVTGCPQSTNQIVEIDDWHAKCGDVITITLRAHSSYIDTLYFNGLTRSVTVVAPCCDCGDDPCDDVDVDALIDNAMEQLTGYHVSSGVINWASPLSEYGPTGINPDHIMLNTFFTFSKSGSGASAKLVITGKALTSYGIPCDIAAFPFEYDRMWFRTFVYAGPATTADFIVSDACNIVATSTITQTSNYPSGTYAEILQLEKNYYSYQVGFLKHLYRMMGYNQNFESFAEPGVNYTTYYIKFNELDRSAYNWGAYEHEDSMVIIAVETGSTLQGVLETALEDALGTVADKNTCITTTSTTTAGT